MRWHYRLLRQHDARSAILLARGTVALRSYLALFAAALSLAAGVAHADLLGRTTGLAVPRFVSVKAKPANVRVGPGMGYPLKWIFVRRFVPVEVTAEFGRWRRIRDWDGSEGWILGALLSGRRTALVAPWLKGKTIPLYSRSDARAAVVARLQPGVFVRPQSCNGGWCDVAVAGRDGYVRQSQLWGVYADERL